LNAHDQLDLISEQKRHSVKLPNIIHESIHCTCPGGCKKKYCVCLKSGLPCNERCSCKDCENDNRAEAEI